MSISPLRCHEARPYLAAYADEELDAGLRTQVEDHLATCADCRQKVAHYHEIDRLLGALPASTPSPIVLDRVLAATSGSNKDQATRESLRQPEKPLVPRSLPAFLLADTNQATPLLPSQQLAQKRRSWVLAGALPTLAAVLIMAITLVAFHSRPGVSTTDQPTPTSASVAVLQTTRQQMQQYAPQVHFIPVVPTYLPPGAQFSAITPGYETDGKIFLDVIWTLGPPFATLELRETSEQLQDRRDYLTTQGDALTTWQLAQIGAPQWIRMTTNDNSPNHIVVGQNHSNNLSITLDLTFRSGADPTANLIAAANDLRSTSLSLDAPYQPLPGIAAPDQSSVVYYEITSTTQPAYTWKVYADQQKKTAKVEVYSNANTLVYTDYWTAETVTRFDPQNRSEPLSSAPADPYPLSNSIKNFASADINSYLSYGELWNIKGFQLPSQLQTLGVTSKSVYALALVNAPQPTTVYVDSLSKRVVGIVVDANSPIQPGGAYATSAMQSNPCLIYTLVAYLPANSEAAITNLQQPRSQGPANAISSVSASC